MYKDWRKFPPIIIVFNLLLVIGFLGCSDGTEDGPGAPLNLINPVSSDTPPRYDWQDPDLPSRLDQALESWREDYGIYGASARVTSWGWFDWSGASGETHINLHTPFRTDSEGRIASATKPFTATIILQLIDEGRLSLDTRMSEFFPDYPNSHAITVEHLLRHRSGIPEVQLVDLFFIMDVLLHLDHWYTPEEILLWTYDPPVSIPFVPDPLPIFSIRTDPMGFVPREPLDEPGGNFHYSQPGYFVLGAMIQEITGISLADAIFERIASPLGLTNTYMPPKDAPPFPIGYSNMFGLLPLKLPSDLVLRNTANGLVSCTWAAGGMISTSRELVRFFSAMLQGLLFSEQAMENALDWRLVEPGDIVSALVQEYGMGLGKSKVSDYICIGHDGELPGAGSYMRYFPELDVYIGAVFNTDLDRGTGTPDLSERIISALRPF